MEVPGAKPMTMKERWDRNEILDEKANSWSNVGCSYLSQAIIERAYFSLTNSGLSAHEKASCRLEDAQCSQGVVCSLH